MQTRKYTDLHPVEQRFIELLLMALIKKYGESSHYRVETYNDRTTNSDILLLRPSTRTPPEPNKQRALIDVLGQLFTIESKDMVVDLKVNNGGQGGVSLPCTIQTFHIQEVKEPMLKLLGFITQEFGLCPRRDAQQTLDHPTIRDFILSRGGRQAIWDRLGESVQQLPKHDAEEVEADADIEGEAESDQQVDPEMFDNLIQPESTDDRQRQASSGDILRAQNFIKIYSALYETASWPKRSDILSQINQFSKQLPTAAKAKMFLSMIEEHCQKKPNSRSAVAKKILDQVGNADISKLPEDKKLELFKAVHSASYRAGPFSFFHHTNLPRNVDDFNDVSDHRIKYPGSRGDIIMTRLGL